MLNKLRKCVSKVKIMLLFSKSKLVFSNQPHFLKHDFIIDHKTNQPIATDIFVSESSLKMRHYKSLVMLSRGFYSYTLRE